MRKTKAEYSRTYYLKNREKVIARNKCWLEKNKDRMLHYWRIRKLGLTFSFEDAQRLRFKQGNQCAICERPETARGRTLSLDHNHVTGKVRGFLCSNCNNGLGRFKDSSQLLQNAILYLEHTNG